VRRMRWKWEANEEILSFIIRISGENSGL
jgi:hypothetical protein